MKNILLFLTMFCAFTANSQVLTSVKTLKTTDLGNQKLQVSCDGKNEYYCILLKTGNAFDKYIEVGLGTKEEAVKLLDFLLNVEVRRGDVIRLENPTGNTAKYSVASGYTVYSLGGYLKGHLRKPNIKSFLKEIKERE